MNWSTEDRSVHIHSDESGRSLTLTPAEKKLIEQSWLHAENKEELVGEVLKRLLMSNEAILRLLFERCGRPVVAGWGPVVVC
ncbi:hypothetical protein M514_20081 [Trichuris suis]|uniref:Uncharacterized protein n=1 Tax=Trichuris suis TaxID=68888 RepID=A0A085NE90_9BILA|nr:hypothetical protein M514_20081 [Trichuris suis]